MKHELNEKELDVKLSSPVQQAIRHAVGSLPDESPSLAWRSALNARLLQAAARRRKMRVFGWMWKPAMGLAVAGALAVAFVMRMPTSADPSSKPDLEKALIGSYVDNAASYEVAGDNVSSGEMRDSDNQLRFDLGQEDVGATL